MGFYILDPFPFDANLCWETEFMLGASHFKGNVWLHEVRTQIVTPAWVLRPKKGLLSWSHSTLCGTLRLSLVLRFLNPKFGYTCVKVLCQSSAGAGLDSRTLELQLRIRVCQNDAKYLCLSMSC